VGLGRVALGSDSIFSGNALFVSKIRSPAFLVVRPPTIIRRQMGNFRKRLALYKRKNITTLNKEVAHTAVGALELVIECRTVSLKSFRLLGKAHENRCNRTFHHFQHLHHKDKANLPVVWSGCMSD